jgi:integrase
MAPKKNASVKIILKKGKVYKSGEHPIILRIIHDQNFKTITTNMTASLDDWNEGLSCYKETVKGYRSKNQTLESISEKAIKIVNDLVRENKPFSIPLFMSRFMANEESMSVFDFYKLYIEEIRSLNRISSSIVYQSSYSVFQQFRNGKDLSFYEFDYTMLKQYEVFLFKRGNTAGGVHFHMRTLRALINEAKNRGYLHKDNYPFSSQDNKSGYSFSKLKPKNNPRSLSPEDLEKLKNFDYLKYPRLANSYLLFMFSYYGRGINFGDMANLTRKNIYDGRIGFHRSKTTRYFSLNIHDRLRSIIDWFHNPESEFLFPILSPFHTTDQQKKDRIHKRLRALNLDLREIAKILAIEINMTSYVARYIYATTLKRNGMSLDMIQELMGHDEVSTTGGYVARFPNHILDQTDELL